MSFSRPNVDVFVRDFSAGFLDSPQSDTIPLGSSPDAKNAILSGIQINPDGSRRAILRRRPGARLINPTAMTAATPVESLQSYKRDDAAAALLAVCKGDLTKWDGSMSFSTLSSGAFTTGRSIQWAQHRNLAFIMDGDRTKLYDGTTLGDPGLTTPGATTLSVGSATGVTGDYEGYVVWVNSGRVIKSSPGTTSALVTFSNEKRTWSRPSSPPAGADYWRVYCRKSTERQYYQIGVDQLVATTSYAEATADDARVTPGPDVSTNDPPPAFEGMVVWNGYGIAWKRNASDIYVSKRDYLESWHPSHVIALRRNQKIRSVALVGGDCLIQTSTSTYRLEGEKFPFALRNLHTQWGNTSAQSWQEIDGVTYAFDPARGPYVTDTVNFASIADNKIRTILNSLNQSETVNIRSAHFKAQNLVMWAVATGTSTRRRVLLAYNYKIRAWLPPITGLEFGSLETFTKSDNSEGLFLGDYWGRVFEFFDTENDGVPSGTDHTKPITGATASTLTCGAASFYTTGNGLAGIPVGILSPTGRWYIRRVQSNTATILTLDTTNDPALTTIPATDGTWTASVGIIEFYWWTPWLDIGAPHIQKRGSFLTIQGGSNNANNVLNIAIRVNGVNGIVETKTMSFPSAGGVWGVSEWSVGIWGGVSSKPIKKRRLARAFYAMQLRFLNYYPDQPFDISGYGVGADPLLRRRAG